MNYIKYRNTTCICPRHFVDSGRVETAIISVIMKAYRIEAGEINMGIYKGATQEEALDAYARDAGYSNYESLVTDHGEVDLIEEV